MHSHYLSELQLIVCFSLLFHKWTMIAITHRIQYFYDVVYPGSLALVANNTRVLIALFHK